MKINFNVNGDRRKALVGAISEITNQPMHYKGAPTFAFEIGGYIVGKDGMVTGEGSISNTDNSELLKALNELGFIGEVADRGDDNAVAEINPADDLGDEDESCRLVIEMPLDGFAPEQLDNLAKLVNAKAPLLKAAIGTDDLPIQQTADKLRFPWFGDGLDADTIKAYAAMIGKICASAKGKHRFTSHERDPENKKYAMRCWLLSLGFIGDEYKTSRKILLSKLDGNSSWKNKQS